MGGVLQAIVLAGGKGTRLRPLTLTLPKPLVPVANRPIIEYILDNLAKAGFSELVVATNYRAEMLASALATYKPPSSPGTRLRVRRLESRDTADAVRRLGGLIKGPFLVSMGDILTNASLGELMKYHRSRGGLATIGLLEVDNPHEFGTVLIDRNGRVVLFIEKPLSQELYLVSLAYLRIGVRMTGRHLVNMGVYAFREDIVDILESEPYLMDFGRHVFPFLLENNIPVYGWPVDAYWRDVGNPREYLYANWDVLDGIAEGMRPPGKEVRPGVWAQDGVDLSPEAIVRPPVALGEGAVVEAGATVGPRTVLGEECVVRRGAVVEASVLWKGVEVGAGALVQSAVIASGGFVGREARVLEYSVLGEGVVVEPGSVVGERAKVWPGVRVRGSIEVGLEVKARS